jgi:hypothetical protein
MSVLQEETVPHQVAARTVSAVAIVLFPIRMFLGMGWLRAGVEKVIDPTWWRGDALTIFLAEHRDVALPFMPAVSDQLFEPLIIPIAIGVVVSQLAIAVSFITTRLLRPALRAAVTLNLVFVAMGAVNPSVFYLVIEITLHAALDHGFIGNVSRRPRPRHMGVKAGIGLALLPYVRTVNPADVIDDPAIILATLAFLAAATDGLAFLSIPDRTSM